MRALTLLALTATMAGTLTVSGCASDQEKWCDRVSAAAPTLGKTLDEGGAKTGLIDALPTLRSLADAAPSDVREDWSTLVDAVSGLADAVAAKDDKATRQAGLKLASPDVQAAANAVDQEARDVCHAGLF
ncbi:hypothetical protein [Nocardioides jejuensis]|uniref:Uncharacterized protein n=1 Tax=Nocardioides jejuensis TaxID=2502782 RepID=A0A4R1BW92_9ACTN|nr:hypothetical protein [Nocardioides jejuensis]TCJ22310.1 hypothetical protein EPD65_13305 [Nocardioides jejuensis]